MYGNQNPNEILFKKDIYSINRENKCFRVYLPFADKSELKLEQTKEELVIGLKNEIRRFITR